MSPHFVPVASLAGYLRDPCVGSQQDGVEGSGFVGNSPSRAGLGCVVVVELTVPWHIQDAHGGDYPIPGGLQGFTSPHFKEEFYFFFP